MKIEIGNFMIMKWIKKKERLPDEGKTVWMHHKDGMIFLHQVKIIAGYLRNHLNGMRFEHGEITHWMSLQKPPKP